MDWVEYVNFIYQRIPQKEIEERIYDYQCTRCLSWKKINDFGIRTTGRIYKQCKRCRETIENGRERRKLKKQKEKIKNEKGIEHISGK